MLHKKIQEVIIFYTHNIYIYIHWCLTVNAVRRCQSKYVRLDSTPKEMTCKKGVGYNCRYQFWPAGVFAISELISAWVCVKCKVMCFIGGACFGAQKELQILKRHRESRAEHWQTTITMKAGVRGEPLNKPWNHNLSGLPWSGVAHPRTTTVSSYLHKPFA